MQKVEVKRGKEQAILRGHPWIFSGALMPDIKAEEGAIVAVVTQDGKTLGYGHYSKGSIAVRLLSHNQIVNQDFWNQKIEKAYQLRRVLYPNQATTNAYRLIHGEGDGLPGLIIDVYDNHAVVQCHSIGMYMSRKSIYEALKKTYGESLKGIYNKSKESLPSQFAKTMQNGAVEGSAEEVIALENDMEFYVNWKEGQKTGFFLDQKDNRHLLETYSNGKKVLNTFSYTGGFSVAALKGGATEVVSVDVSAKAMELCDKNVALNMDNAPHKSYCSDIFDFFAQESEQLFDIVVLDPPAFAKTLDKRHNAIQAYKRLNTIALKQIPSGGLLFTFSCSQVVDRQLFYDTVVAAGIESKRSIKVLHHLTQSPDHPVNLFHPEGSYLKGLVLYVE